MELHKAAGRVAAQFNIAGAVVDIHPYGSGHIHSTFKISAQTTSGPASFLLQKINTHIFPQPEGMTNNLLLANAQLRQQGYRYHCLEPLATKAGTYLLYTIDGVWRMFPFIDNTYSPNQVNTVPQAEEGAKAYGHFLAKLADLPLEQLQITLSDFTNGQLRWQQFEEALKGASHDRLAAADREIADLKEHQKLISSFNWNDFPQRMTHHDTKINNLLFDRDSGVCVAVVDLDTLMPGSWLYDFGDMVRTFCCSESEESPLLEQVYIRADFYAALKRGWLSEVGECLTAQERARLKEGALWVIYVQALRFLTDYLQGDTYYKIQYEGQNLVRAKNQLTLLHSLQDFEEQD